MWPPTHHTHAGIALHLCPGLIESKAWRNGLLGLIVISVILLASGCTKEGASAQAAGKPNILFVMTDDMPEYLWDDMPNLRTHVANKGVRFRNAYVTQSLCCPSRATMLTGKYPHNHGITDNGGTSGGQAGFRASGQDRDTVATRVSAAGYKTALIGKYMNGYDGYVPPGWSYWYAKTGKHTANENGRTVDRSGPFPVTIASKAQAFLESSTDQANDPPFMLFYWTSQPHLPMNVPSGYRNLFTNEKVPRTPAFNEANVSDKPAYIRERPPLTADKVAAADEGYRDQMRTLTHLDDTLANMLDLLVDRGELANTYVVFTTDNGTLMGQHRWLGERGAKQVPYEEAAGVPLIVRGPDVPEGIVRNQLVANNDIAPTFAVWAGVEPPSGTDGRSIASVACANPPTSWRSAVLNEQHKLVDPSPARDYNAVMTKRYTYVEYATGEKELYDRAVDPYELQSKHDRPAYANTMAALSLRLHTLEGCKTDACRTAENGP
jgi:N-acetylglucosamine-6-sulfatase